MPAKTLIAVTLAFAAAAPALAQESLPTFRASVRTDANFPNPEDAARKGGAFVAPEAVLRVTPGMTKSQVYTLLDVPHFSEGLFGERTWDYILNFYTGAGDAWESCQYQIRFNKRARIEDAYWRTQACRDLAERLVAPPPVVAEPAPRIEPASVQLAPANFHFQFGHDSVGVAAYERRMAGEIADTFKSGGFQRVTVVGMADTSGNPRYNHSLAQRRAAVVADLLRGTFAERGLPTGVFQVGATQDLTVPTPAGVREPANRRVNVMLGM
jgi:OOP family OmpA-OmpF porin